MIMVRHWFSEPLKFSLKLASQPDPSEIGRNLKRRGSNLPASIDVDVRREIATFPQCTPSFPFGGRRIERKRARDRTCLDGLAYPDLKLSTYQCRIVLTGVLPRIHAGGEECEGKFDQTLPTGSTQTSVRFTSLDSCVKSAWYK